MSASSNRKKLVFIGRIYHLKTKSDELILNILKKHFEVFVLRREEYSDEQLVQKIKEYEPQVALFWCLPPSISNHLKKLKGIKIIWAPMWDGFKELSWRRRFLFAWYQVKIICFSQAVANYFKKTKLQCGYWQCFLEPMAHLSLKKSPPYTFFFWQRETLINLKQIVAMIGEKNIGKMIYKSELEKINPLDYPFEIEELPMWMDKEAYLEKIKSADFYIAPRTAEGIGFSFLEPMSLGKIIIGYDNSTMNEYIQEGKNGYLFDLNFKLRSPLQSPHEMSQQVQRKIDSLHQGWEKEKENICDFLLKESL